MESVLYLTCTKLPCIGTSQAPIVLCIADTIALVSGNQTLPGFLITSTEVIDDCNCVGYWRYTLAYDETLLTDPETLLVPENITGIFCETCFSDWLKELIAIGPAVPAPAEIPWIDYPINIGMLDNVTVVDGLSSYRIVDGVCEWILRMACEVAVDNQSIYVDLPVPFDEAVYMTDYLTKGYVRFATGVFATLNASCSSGYFFKDVDLVHKLNLKEPIGNWNLIAPFNHVGFTLRYRVQP